MPLVLSRRICVVTYVMSADAAHSPPALHEDKCVPYLGQWCSGTRALRGHSEHCGDPQANTSRCSIHIDPEGDPGQNDNKEAGDVHLDQVIAHLPLQVETSFYTGELAWEGWEKHGRLLVKHGEPPVFSYCLGTFLTLPRTRVLLEGEINSCCPVLKYEHTHQQSKENSCQCVLCHLNFTHSLASKTKEDAGRESPDQTPLNWCRHYGGEEGSTHLCLLAFYWLYMCIFTGNISMCIYKYVVPSCVGQGLYHQSAIRQSKRLWYMYSPEFLSNERSS